MAPEDKTKESRKAAKEAQQNVLMKLRKCEQTRRCPWKVG